MIRVNWGGKDTFLSDADYTTWLEEESLSQQHMAMQAGDDEGYCDE